MLGVLASPFLHAQHASRRVWRDLWLCVPCLRRNLFDGNPRPIHCEEVERRLRTCGGAMNLLCTLTRGGSHGLWCRRLDGHHTEYGGSQNQPHAPAYICCVVVGACFSVHFMRIPVCLSGFVYRPFHGRCYSTLVRLSLFLLFLARRCDSFVFRPWNQSSGCTFSRQS